MSDEEIITKSISDIFTVKQQLLAVAESCTGGMLAKACTDLSGSSAWFERGFVTYSNVAKIEMLGVSHKTLTNFGAVSEQVVKEMSAGALRNSCAHWSIAVSGVAGPGGGTLVNPVGTVWLAWRQVGQNATTEKILVDGDRAAVREQTVKYALEKLLELIQ